MERRLKIRDCLELLHVDAKTFHRWLAKADIDLDQQRNPADTREKWLTTEQILFLARTHGREVSLPNEAEPPATAPAQASTETVPTARLHEILTQLRQLTQRIDQLDARLTALPDELRQAGAPVLFPAQAPSPASSTSIPKARITPIAPAPTSASTPPPKPAATKRQKRKATTKSKKLPATLTPLSLFRQTHGMSEKAVAMAVQRSKLAVIRGAWHHQHRYITTALDQQGQQAFYALFHEREDFTNCDQCPHALPASS